MIFIWTIRRWSNLSILIALLALFASPILAQQSAPDADHSTSVNEQYRIRSGDKLSIKFFYHPELNESSVVVRPDGRISLSIIDEVQAKGLTAAELKVIIEKAYSETLLNPIVTVNLVEYVAPRIFVAGQVSKPGSYELRAGQTLTQVIALAGGFTRNANRKNVLHARPASGNKMKTMTYDTLAILSGSTAAPDVLLQDGDYVFVPDSKLSKVEHIIEVFRAAMPGIGIGLGY